VTRASAARRERRRLRGRPKHNGVAPAEHLKIQLASALQVAWGLSERAAFDLVVALAEAEEVASEPPGFRLPMRTFSGRISTLRKKRGAAPPDEMAALMTLALRCRDMATAVRLFRGLLMMANTRGAAAVAQTVRQLLDEPSRASKQEAER
jgi:hypothetical protein